MGNEESRRAGSRARPPPPECRASTEAIIPHITLSQPPPAIHLSPLLAFPSPTPHPMQLFSVQCCKAPSSCHLATCGPYQKHLVSNGSPVLTLRCRHGGGGGWNRTLAHPKFPALKKFPTTVIKNRRPDSPETVLFSQMRFELFRISRMKTRAFKTNKQTNIKLVLSALDPSKSGLMNKHIVKHKRTYREHIVNKQTNKQTNKQITFSRGVS
jgi:hypothetical protein